MAEERIRRKLQFPNDERLAPSHYQTRRGTAVGRAPARQCLPLSGRMPQAIRPLCLSLSGHLPRELLMPPHATPPQPNPTPSITPSRGAAHLPGPNPHASTRGGPKWPAGRQRQGAGWLPGNSPQVEGESGSKPTPALESPEALSKPTPVDSPPKEAEGGQGRSQLAGRQTCQGHGWGAARVPDEERETRSVGRAGWRLLLALEPGSGPGQRAA